MSIHKHCYFTRYGEIFKRDKIVQLVTDLIARYPHGLAQCHWNIYGPNISTQAEKYAVLGLQIHTQLDMSVYSHDDQRQITDLH